METRTALDGNQMVVHVYRNKNVFIDVDTKAHYSSLWFFDTKRNESAEELYELEKGQQIIVLPARSGGKTAKMLKESLTAQRKALIDKACAYCCSLCIEHTKEECPSPKYCKDILDFRKAMEE